MGKLHFLSLFTVLLALPFAFFSYGLYESQPEHIAEEFTGTLPGTSFVHRATTGNVSGNRTLINNALLNNNPTAIILVTQNWNPGGTGGIYNPTDVGVYYDSLTQRWGIFNQDASPMPIGAAFNVYVTDPNAAAFVHTSTSGNTSLYWTNIAHHLANNMPQAHLFTTHLFATPEHTGEYHPHSLGMRYGSDNQWSILNQDNAYMNLGVDFNVLITPEHPNIYTHIATEENTGGPTGGPASFLDHPLLLNNPYAIVTLTQNWNPGGSSGVYNDHPISVWYDVPTRRWCVFNEDIANIPIGSAYNVMIEATVVYLPAFYRTN